MFLQMNNYRLRTGQSKYYYYEIVAWSVLSVAIGNVNNSQNSKNERRETVGKMME